MTTRRCLLKGCMQGALVGLSLPRIALADSTVDHNLIWITCFGGWDPTRTLVPAFDSPLVNLEPIVEPMEFGGLRLVDHPGRPSVREFFQQYSELATVLHGVLTPSVAHEACLQLIRTGMPAGQADWPTILASELFAHYPIPHMVLSGHAFPGDMGHMVARTGSGEQLKALLNGTLSNSSDVFVSSTTQRLRTAESQMRQRRLSQLIEQSNQDPMALLMLEQFESNALSADVLRSKESALNWNVEGSFFGDCLTAVDLLREGVTPCISIEHPALWDSHSSNDVYQHWLWEELFAGLLMLCNELKATPTSTGNLLNNTTIVVASDMGRAPRLNSSQGKDHWPYSSLLVLSNQMEGQRSIGGYDDGFQGVSLSSGFGLNSDQQLTAAHFGHAILGLWGVSHPSNPVVYSIFD